MMYTNPLITNPFDDAETKFRSDFLLKRDGPIAPPYFSLRTLVNDHTFQFDYMLFEQKIWIRSRTPHAPKTFLFGTLYSDINGCHWHLFNQTGLPTDEQGQSLLDDSLGEFLCEFQVASENVIAVSNLNRVFFFDPTQIERPTVWKKKFGQPLPGYLYLPENRRSWSFSCSLRDKPIDSKMYGDGVTPKRMTQHIHPNDRVVYFRDGNGVAFDFGHTSTIYCVNQTGQFVNFTDSGLPPSFKYGFLSPQNGSTQIQCLSAAASSVFVSCLNSLGQIKYYIRDYDFEIFGGCPGNPTSLTIHEENPREPKNSMLAYGTVPLGKGIRKHPLTAWHEIVIFVPQEFLTCTVSVHLTGQGNLARCLRILGYQSGIQGYYEKHLQDTFNPYVPWSFYPLNKTVATVQIPYEFNFDLPNPLKNYTLVESKDKLFAQEIKINLFNVHQYSSYDIPSQLCIQMGEFYDFINLHIIPAWGLTCYSKHQEELVGTVDGETMLMFGTLVLSNDQLNGRSPVSNFINTFLLKYHDNVHEFILLVDDMNVNLFSKDKKINLTFERAFLDARARSIEIRNSFYVKKCFDPVLVCTQPCVSLLEKALVENKKMLRAIQEIHLNSNLSRAKYAALHTVARPLHAAADKLVHKFPPRQVTLPKAMEYTRGLFALQARASLEGATRFHPGFIAACNILKSRISAYKHQLKLISLT